MVIPRVDRVISFAERLVGGGPVHVALTPLTGGLEAASVALARVRGPRRRRRAFVVKVLDGAALRELAVYDLLERAGAARLGPARFGRDLLPDGRALLFLEVVRARERWPWRHIDATAGVVGGMAALHERFAGAAPVVADTWDYESLLADRAAAALAQLEEAPRRVLPLGILRMRPALRRLTLALGRHRRQLLAAGRAPITFIHGDVHSANVVWRARMSLATGGEVVLIDWARARLGSPLEDVSSWLQSLGLWEPEARRRHDTLLGYYLSERGQRRRIDEELRALYWISAASNVLAGALSYHLGCALAAVAEGHPPSVIADAWRPVQGWGRVIRRADAFWC